MNSIRLTGRRYLTCYCFLVACLFSGCIWDEPERIESAKKEIQRFNGKIIGGDAGRIPGIVITGRDISRLDWKEVLPLKSLFMIDLSGTNFSDDDIDVLLTSPHLHEIHLSHTDITDAGIAHLREMHQIRDLYLRGCNITDACLDDLLGMKNLRYVVLHETHISDEAAARLGDKADHSTTASEEVRRALTGLEQGNCKARSNVSGFRRGASDHLQFLVEFDDSPTTSEETIVRHLKALSKSGEMDVRLLDDEMTPILKSLPQIRNLEIFTDSNDFNFNVSLLKGLKDAHARTVYVSVGQLDADAYAGVGAIQSMRVLILEETQITPQDWANITSSASLEKLEFHECTFVEVERFKAVGHSIKIKFINCDEVSEQLQDQIKALAS